MNNAIKQFHKRVNTFFMLMCMLSITAIMSVMIVACPVNAAKVKLSSKKITMHVDKTTILRLNNYKKGKAKWTSSNTSIVSVKKLSKRRCQIQGKKAGTATVTCKLGKKIYTCKVSIKNHNFKKISTSKPTCTRTGKKTYRCSCGKTKTKTIARLSHKNKTITLKATCVHNGAKVRYCTVCGKVKSSKIIPALGHLAPESTETSSETASETTASGTTTSGTTASGTTANETTASESSDQNSDSSSSSDQQTGDSETTTYVCVRCKQIIDTKTLTCVDEKDHKYVDGVCIYCGAKKISEALFASLEKVGSKMVSKKWVYSNSGVGKTYSEAKSKKKANCAAYVSYAMQEAGLLEAGQKFYSGTKGYLHMSDEERALLVSEGAVFYVYSSGISVADLQEANNLQEGDIVLWNYHTNVFKGYTSKGKPSWYDGGKSCTKLKKSGSKYIRYQRTGYTGFTSNNKVYGIIRFLQ